MNEDSQQHNIRHILKVANLVGKAESNQFIEMFDDDDSTIRYWAVIGISANNDVTRPILEQIKALLDDSNPSVRIAAAEALFIHGNEKKAMEVILKELNLGNDENNAK